MSKASQRERDYLAHAIARRVAQWREEDLASRGPYSRDAALDRLAVDVTGLADRYGSSPTQEAPASSRRPGPKKPTPAKARPAQGGKAAA